MSIETRWLRKTCLTLWAVLAAGTASAAATPEPAPAPHDAPVVGNPDLPWLDNQWYKVHLNVRARIGLADVDGFEASEAYTLRTRAGLEARPWHGFSALAELENTWSIADQQYFDGASAPSGNSLIADPENTELNRAYLQYESQSFLGTPVSAKAKAGRQRIIYDDARFIGNVGWRQNEQTYYSAFGQTNLSVDDLQVQYAYLWDIQRIFGDQGPSSSTHDFSSDSHLARVNYKGFEHLDLTAFAYLLDFEKDSPSNSSNSYGVRGAGRCAFDETWSLGYSASYAFQTDAANNPVSYEVHYFWGHLDVKKDDLGSFGVTYEFLGSDDGKAVFVTPLATGHKFNGFADAFLDNGGVRGLQDLAFTVTPKLPWKLGGHVAYHEFWRADGGAHLGRELDGVLSRPINDYLMALAKGAWFDGDSSGPADRWRLTFEINFKF